MAAADEAARGLGLAIAKRVCDMQGWSLAVASSREAGARGTIFTLHFEDGAQQPAAAMGAQTRI
ncbi:hypothetical protein D9M71_835460 [compost metagenome]